MSRWLAVCGAVAVAFLAGRLSSKPTVRTETKTVEVTKWREKIVTVASKNESAEKQENVRVVTRWLRRNGTLAKEQASEAASTQSSTSQTSTAKSSQRHVDVYHASKSATANAPTYQRRLQVGGLLGLDLRNRLERRWGAYATYRLAGPVTVGGWWVPGMAGASVGLTF